MRLARERPLALELPKEPGGASGMAEGAELAS
jgi:hypothetical protein